MSKDLQIYIDDILFSIKLIEQYTKGVNFETFDNSYDIQDKVLHRLEIIAEAAKKLPERIRKSHNDIKWKSIIGLRNIIAHNYDEVNNKEIWNIVITHLPDTKERIEKMKITLPKNS